MKGLADLPHFEIVEFLPTTPFDGPGFSGRFNHIQGVAEGVCWLRVAADKYSKGGLHALSQPDKTAIFLPWEGKEHIQIGLSLPWIDGYWKKEKIEMVVNPSWPWKRLRFQPRDAWKTDADIGAIAAKAPDGSTVAPAGVTVIRGGWDHEHCGFCWKTIGVGGEPVGFKDDYDNWLCEDCFQTYVAEHDLSFMDVFGKTWPAANSTG